MANTKLAQAAPGTVVKINESGAPVDFLVLQQGYPESGNGNVLLIRQSAYSNSAWGTGSSYLNSTVDTFLQNTYTTYISEEIAADMQTVAIPYTVGNGNWTLSTMERKAFLLSRTELGFAPTTGALVEGNAIAYFSDNASRIANYSGSAANWWTRTPYTQASKTVYIVGNTGAENLFESSRLFSVRPAFCLTGANWELTEDGTLVKASAGGANTPLKDMLPGSIVKTNYNGQSTNFVVLHQGKPSPIYDDSFNGGAIMRFESIPENYQWTTTGTNDYAASGVQAHIQEYVQYFDPTIQSNIKTVKIPYRPGAGSSATVNSGADGLECQMYLLSVTELGITQGDVPVDGAKLDYYLAGTGADAQKKRVANLNGAPARYNTRSPYVNAPATTAAIWEVQAGGNIATIHTGSAFGALTAFVLDANALYVDADGFLTTESGGTGMFIPASELEQGVEYYFRVFPRNHQNQFQTGIDGSQLHMVVADGNEAVPDDSAPAEIIPSYTGNSQIFGDGTKGYIELYDSGVLTFNKDVTGDLFLVGGGGGGSTDGGGSSSHHGGGGGGGGYTSQFVNANFTKNEEIAVTIGAGGAAGTAGGATSIGSYSVNGGSPGSRQNAGAGGSGGGGGGYGVGYSFAGGPGGSNGSNGTTGGGGQTGAGYAPGGAGGTGQGTSTYEFLNSQLRLFAGGGGGGGGGARGAGAAGGNGGGGRGGNGGDLEDGYIPTDGVAGTANTGGGGGGSGGRDYASSKAGAGGSGIAIIRWGDWSTSDTGSSTGGAN